MSSSVTGQEGQAPSKFVRPEGRVLIVDDESSVRRALHSALFSLGFDIGEASDGDEAIALCRITRYDVVLLDIKMPGKSGIQTCDELRRLMPRIAILMLSVYDDHERIVEALDAGADDYVTKPFHMRELTARIGAALRRVRATSGESYKVIAIGDLSLDPERRLVQQAGQAIHLTPKEFDLLHYLMLNAGKPIAHSRLLIAVWGPDYGGELEYLRTFIRQLRKKLEDDPSQPAYLMTEMWFGYRFQGEG